MVVIFLFPTLDKAVPQERTATPSRCTVHAPHCCRPQPNFVPVKPIASRITQSSGVSGLTSTSYCFPFTVSEIIADSSRSEKIIALRTDSEMFLLGTAPFSPGTSVRRCTQYGRLHFVRVCI